MDEDEQEYMCACVHLWVDGKTNESARLACFLARDYRTQGAG